MRFLLAAVGVLGFASLFGVMHGANTASASEPFAGVVVAHEVMQPVIAPTSTVLATIATSSEPTQPVEQKLPDSAATPVSLGISSIGLTAPIVPVGTNDKGEMDVPSGTTQNVGWYQYGTVPGQDGSAVLDAHVFAAFKNLRYAKVGDHVSVAMSDGTTRDFVIRASMVYKLQDVPRDLLFDRTGGKYLNLITCAGAYVPSADTYDHRLVVYAELVQG